MIALLLAGVLHASHPILHWRPVRMQVTAYCYGTTTFTGTHVRRGSVAVWPRQIPFGTILLIPGYGWGTAVDTGSAITWGHLDVYMRSCKAAWRWGRRNMTVYVLKGVTW